MKAPCSHTDPAVTSQMRQRPAFGNISAEAMRHYGPSLAGDNWICALTGSQTEMLYSAWEPELGTPSKSVKNRIRPRRLARASGQLLGDQTEIYLNMAHRNIGKLSREDKRWRSEQRDHQRQQDVVQHSAATLTCAAETAGTSPASALTTKRNWNSICPSCVSCWRSGASAPVHPGARGRAGRVSEQTAAATRGAPPDRPATAAPRSRSVPPHPS